MMKTASLISISARVSKLALALAVVSAFAVTSAHAEDAKPLAATSGKIAVVDIQHLVSNSKAGKSIRSQLDGQRDAYLKKIEKQEIELNKIGKELKEAQPKLAKEEFGKRLKSLDEKAKKGQQEVYERKKAFEKAYVSALEKLRGHIVKIVTELAGKGGISLVLDRQDAVLVDAKMDLTKQVLTELDNQVSSIPVNVN